MLPKKTYKILNFRIMLSNKNSLRKLIPFKLNNVQGFKMFLFTSLSEYRGEGMELAHYTEPHSEEQLGDISEASVSPNHRPGSSCLVIFGYACFLVSPQISFHKLSNKGDFSSNTEDLVFPQEYTHASMTAASSWFQKALVIGF